VSSPTLPKASIYSKWTLSIVILSHSIIGYRKAQVNT
jgi:hypothetical protein